MSKHHGVMPLKDVNNEKILVVHLHFHFTTINLIYDALEQLNN